MAYTIVPRPFQIYQNVTMTVLVQGQSSRLILTKTWWNIDNLAIIFVICNLGNKSFPLVSVHDIDLQLWPSSRSNFENIDDWLTISISHEVLVVAYSTGSLASPRPDSIRKYHTKRLITAPQNAGAL